MTEHVRKSYRSHRKATWAGVLVVPVLAMLAIAIPALGQTTDANTGVRPPSGEGVYPSVVPVGGSNFDCAKAGTGYASPSTPLGMKQFQISNPVPGTYTDPATGVQFVISAPSAGKDPKAFMSFSVVGGAAVVYHVGIKGGTNTSWYDYVNNTPAHPFSGSDGVVSDTDLHSTPDSQYRPTPPSKNTFFAASITTFCYADLGVSTSCDVPFGPDDSESTSSPVQYTALLVRNSLGQCKDESVVMFARSAGPNDLEVQLSPIDTDGPSFEVVEHIRLTGIDDDNQNPITIWYDDIGPTYGDVQRTMLQCNSDPRDPDGSPFVLPALPPTGRGLLPGDHTSCMLESTDSAGSGPNDRTYDIWIYSSVDGKRGS